MRPWDIVIAADKVLWRLGLTFRNSSALHRAKFTRIAQGNVWGDTESVSGPGSTAARASDVRQELLDLLDRVQIESMVDAPCGDFNWMRNILGDRPIAYVGVDIVDTLIAANCRRDGGTNRRFIAADLTRADLPRVDLIVSRDGLVHLSFSDIHAAIRNLRRSGSRYLLATTFIDVRQNVDVPTGGWRVLNMQAAPFNFPAPLALLDEKCTHTGGVYRDKRLGLWRLDSLG
jgi:hypothetical protein